MPQTTEEERLEWGARDGANEEYASVYLRAQGYSLNKSWQFVTPSGHTVTEEEIDASNYMIDEWDYGGLVVRVDDMDDVRVLLSLVEPMPTFDPLAPNEARFRTGVTYKLVTFEPLDSRDLAYLYDLLGQIIDTTNDISEQTLRMHLRLRDQFALFERKER